MHLKNIAWHEHRSWWADNGTDWHVIIFLKLPEYLWADKTNRMSVRPVWSKYSLSAWRNIGPLATNWAHSEDSVQSRRMPRLIWVFAGRTFILLVLPCRGSYVLITYIWVFTAPVATWCSNFTTCRVIWTVCCTVSRVSTVFTTGLSSRNVAALFNFWIKGRQISISLTLSCKLRLEGRLPITKSKLNSRLPQK